MSVIPLEDNSIDLKRKVVDEPIEGFLAEIEEIS